MNVLLGWLFGSFIHCLAVRYPHYGLLERSHCPHCGHILGIFDLLPLVSFLRLGGRCRYCHHPIPWDHLLAELLFGLAGGLLLPQPSGIFKFILWCGCYLLIWVDCHQNEIPTTSLVLLTLGLLPYASSLPFWNLFFTFALLLPFNLMGWLGFGDTQLLLIMQIYLGPPLFAKASLVACVLGLCLSLNQKKKEIPFGPSLCLGLLIGLLMG